MYQVIVENRPVSAKVPLTSGCRKGHLAYFVQDLVADLDLGEIERRLQAKNHRDERPYAPRMMTALLLYGYAFGVLLEDDRTSDLRGCRPSDVGGRRASTPHDNQRVSTDPPSQLCRIVPAVLTVCMSAGLVKRGHVAIDGTKMKRTRVGTRR